MENEKQMLKVGFLTVLGGGGFFFFALSSLSGLVF